MMLLSCAHSHSTPNNNTKHKTYKEMYSLLLEAYVRDTAERNRLLCAIDTIPVVAKKAEWALRWIDGGDGGHANAAKPFAARLLAFACVEGIHFSGR